MGSSNKSVILALNGNLMASPGDYQELINSRGIDCFVAADGGALFLEKLGYTPHVVVGDLDSLSREQVAGFREQGVIIEQYPTDKDETDGELALNYCQSRGFQEITILGAMGGRFDQQLANIFLLEYASSLGLSARIEPPGYEIGLIEELHLFRGLKGSRLSLLPLSGSVEDIYIKGCKYRLTGETLFRHRTRGISNLITETPASVRVGQGKLIYIIDKNNNSPG